MAQTKEGGEKLAAARYGLSLEEYRDRVKTHSWCNGCSAWRLRCEFSIDRSRSTGLKKKCHVCDRVKEKKPSLGMLGKKHTEESKQKMRKPRPGVYTNSHRIGTKHTDETRAKISQIVKERALRGPQCHSWKGGIKSENEKARASFEYKEWRKAVFERDKYTCQHCGDSKGGNLNAHHLKGFALYPELRYEVSNGLTLCEPCHEEVHRKGAING